VVSRAPVEVPVYISTAGEGVAGVVTVPGEPDAQVGVILMAGRARDRTHRNGMWVEAARELAERGMYALRLDYPGVGNSTGDPVVFDLERPPTFAVQAAARFLLEHTPVRRVILAATCFGGRVVLDAAPEIPEVDAVAVIASPVYARGATVRTRLRSLVRRARRRTPQVVESSMGNRAQQQREVGPPVEQRVSPAFARALTGFLRRGTVYFLYAENDFVTDELRFALEQLRPDASRYRLDVLPGDLHSFRSLDAQRTTIDLVVSWCERVAAERPVARV